MKAVFRKVFELSERQIKRLADDYNIDLNNEDKGEIEDELKDALHDADRCGELEEYTENNPYDDEIELFEKTE